MPAPPPARRRRAPRGARLQRPSRALGGRAPPPPGPSGRPPLGGGGDGPLGALVGAARVGRWGGGPAPLARVGRGAARRNRARGVEQDRGAAAARRTREHLADARCVLV